jgi:hypothetical protein
MQLITVKVVNGRLNVQLLPNTSSDPVAFYSVTYHSAGRVQFRETWAVPPSAARFGCGMRVPAAHRGSRGCAGLGPR